MNFFKEHLQILKNSGGILLTSFLSYNMLDEVLSKRIQESLNSPSGVGPELWFFGILSLFLGITIPTLNLASVLSSIQISRGAAKSPAAFFSDNFSQLLIETMRCWGSALTWGLCFIIPGFLRFFELLFVPFIVVSDQGYAQGKVDALKASKPLVLRNWFKLSIILFVFDFVIPLITHSVFDSHRSLINTPIPAILLNCADIVSFAISIQLCFQIFQKAVTPEIRHAST